MIVEDALKSVVWSWFSSIQCRASAAARTTRGADCCKVRSSVEARPTDGLKAAEMLAKMCGWNEPERVNVQSVEVKVDAALIEQLRAGYAQLAARESGKDALEETPLALAQEGPLPGAPPGGGLPSIEDGTEARNCFYSILLAIVENIPSSLPRLHKINPPERGSRLDGWTDWHINLRGQ
jgi:hypothetical protein